ncbi:MAG: bacillithiol biosynthesis cysteine-adding enzyme BshC [Bacteroidota bacterium]
MQKSSIAYKNTGYFSKLICDYLDNKNEINSFYSHFPNKEGFAKAIADKNYTNDNRAVLVRSLLKQYEHLTFVSGTTKNNINLLQNTNAYTVTTGHQLCLFTGPLYFIYKIVTTINLAQQLKKDFSDNHFVPVYWMATEDHDFEEVNHFVAYGKKVVWNTEQKGAVGRFLLNDIATVVEELKIILGTAPGAEKAITLFENAYLKNKNLAEATRYLVNELFTEYGLVIIDGDDAELKKCFSPYMHKELVGRESENLVQKTSAALETLNYKAQVTAREINLFYLKDSVRERIVFANDKYEVLNTNITFSQQELETELNQHPERFSPNVILRPLYQEVILPNIAYIGGGGEIAYWLQLKSIFENDKISFPVLVLRNSVLVVDKNSKDKLQKIDVSVFDLFGNTDELIKEFTLKHASVDFTIEKEEELIKGAYALLHEKANKVDVTLKPSVDAELQKQLNVLNMLLQKMIKAEKQKQEVQLNQIKNIKAKLFPVDGLQERSENFVMQYIKHDKGFIATLQQHLNPLDFNFTVLEE